MMMLSIDLSSEWLVSYSLEKCDGQYFGLGLADSRCSTQGGA
jgi:hypothetical protein